MQTTMKPAAANYAGPQTSSGQGRSTATKYVGPPSVLSHYPIPMQYGTAYQITIEAGSQQVMHFHWPNNGHALVSCWSYGLHNKVKLFLKLGSPPTLDNWDRRSQSSDSSAYDSETLVTPSIAGTYYILIQGRAAHRSASIYYEWLIT
jgi:hypothetical protein